MKKIYLFIIALLLFLIWLYFVNPQETLQNIKNINLRPAIYGFCLMIVVISLCALRLKIIINQFKPISFFQTFRIYGAASLISYYLGFQLGTPAQLYFFKKLEKINVSHTLSSLITVKIWEYNVIFFFLLFLPLFPFKLKSAATIISLFSAFYFVCVFIGLILVKKQSSLEKFWNKILFFLPSTSQSKWQNFWSSFLSGLKICLENRIISLKTIIISAIILIFQALTLIEIAGAFNLNIPFTTGILAQCLNTVLLLLPPLPAQIGNNEIYASLIFTAGFAYPKSIIAGAAILSHFLIATVILILGVFSFLSLGIGLLELKKEIEKIGGQEITNGLS